MFEANLKKQKMANRFNKKLFTVFVLTAGFVAVTQILDAHGTGFGSSEAAKMASDTIEIMAKSASNASGSSVATGTALLDQLLGGDGKFLLATLGGGGIAGWAVGYTLKKVAKIVALFLGITFISLQYLAYKNIITVDWSKVQNAVDKQHLEQSAQGFMSVLTYNLPFAGTFLVGFWLGFRKG